jgi:hypothetical protein
MWLEGRIRTQLVGGATSEDSGLGLWWDDEAMARRALGSMGGDLCTLQCAGKLLALLLIICRSVLEKTIIISVANRERRDLRVHES